MAPTFRSILAEFRTVQRTAPHASTTPGPYSFVDAPTPYRSCFKMRSPLTARVTASLVKPCPWAVIAALSTSGSMPCLYALLTPTSVARGSLLSEEFRFKSGECSGLWPHDSLRGVHACHSRRCGRESRAARLSRHNGPSLGTCALALGLVVALGGLRATAPRLRTPLACTAGG